SAMLGCSAASAVGIAYFLGISWSLLPSGRPRVHAYASVAWTLAGFLAVHVLFAALFAVFVAARLRRGLVTPDRPLESRITAGLWRYTVAQGLVAWAVLHLFPRLA